jgi:hypothetical protein
MNVFDCYGGCPMKSFLVALVVTLTTEITDMETFLDQLIVRTQDACGGRELEGKLGKPTTKITTEEWEDIIREFSEPRGERSALWTRRRSLSVVGLLAGGLEGYHLHHLVTALSS